MTAHRKELKTLAEKADPPIRATTISWRLSNLFAVLCGAGYAIICLAAFSGLFLINEGVVLPQIYWLRPDLYRCRARPLDGLRLQLPLQEVAPPGADQGAAGKPPERPPRDARQQ
jgi:hypothetical protein